MLTNKTIELQISGKFYKVPQCSIKSSTVQAVIPSLFTNKFIQTALKDMHYANFIKSLSQSK